MRAVVAHWAVKEGESRRSEGQAGIRAAELGRSGLREGRRIEVFATAYRMPKYGLVETFE